MRCWGPPGVLTWLVALGVRLPTASRAVLVAQGGGGKARPPHAGNEPLTPLGIPGRGGTLLRAAAALWARTEHAAGPAPNAIPARPQGPGTDAACTQRIAAAIAEGRPCEEEMLCHAKGGGRVFWAQLHISPIAGEDAPGSGGAGAGAGPQRHVAIFADVSGEDWAPCMASFWRLFCLCVFS